MEDLVDETKKLCLAAASMVEDQANVFALSIPSTYSTTSNPGLKAQEIQMLILAG